MRPLVTTLLLAASAAAGAAAAPAAERVDFNAQVRPILNRHCTACHGGVKQASDLSFIYRDQALGKAKSGLHAIVPGKPDESELVRRITTDDPDDRMPPPHEHPEGPTADEQKLLAEWIAQGAEWGDHWAFIPPERTELPSAADPWPRQPVDHFIAARLAAEGLTPSKPAPPVQWLRRTTFALTGLPPTAGEIRSFEAARRDAPDDDGAYDAVVEALLASPHFGERWAAVWLDLARYADSMGYEKDAVRTIWPYRDWLIRALNDDLPYDQFVIKQLAGDLLDNPTLDDLIATGFHRNTQTNAEGGTDDEEFRIAAVIDRVNTTWTVFQGITFGCVQCHAHPYDPFRHDEYYRFAAFFNNNADCDLRNEFPTVKVPDDPARWGEAAALRRELTEVSRQVMAPFREAASQAEWLPFEPEHFWDNKEQVDLTTAHEGGRKLIVLDGNAVQRSTYEVVGNSGLRRVEAVRVAVPLAPGDDAANPSEGFVVNKFELRLRRSGNHAPGADFENVPVRFVAVDEANSMFFSPAWGAFPNQFHPRWAILVPETPIELGDDDRLAIVLHQNQGRDGATPPVLQRFYLEVSGDPAWQALAGSSGHRDLVKRRDGIVKSLKDIPGPTMPVIRDREEFPRSTAVFNRGNWLDKGEVVAPGVPAIMPKFDPAGHPRLAMAEWLVSSDHPLTTRVIVNRVWAELFGTGLVETLEDFGSTGASPSHPALLDDLAVRFRTAHQWSLKALLRELVLSATFRQNHAVTPALLERDPRNRLLTRGPRLRLSAEMVRDHALATGGLLSPKMFGPPVKPPQPDGLWDSPYSNLKWVTAKGEDRHRRGIYTFWRRSAPYPSFETFDAPERRVCSPRRISTNTPLQALVTLNDPVYVEASQGLAKRMREHSPSLRNQLAFGYRLAASEDPEPAYLDILATAYEDARDAYTAMPA
ncbi:MAG: DUF1553 domain-containing protein, partial [Akkermansiaceae bacterium]|nr:DUF1553 domain-containing protein [Akkermansiaceae bacterium]